MNYNLLDIQSMKLTILIVVIFFMLTHDSMSEQQSVSSKLSCPPIIYIKREYKGCFSEQLFCFIILNACWSTCSSSYAFS